MNRLLAAFAIALSFATSTVLAQDKRSFVFTAIPDFDETRLVERFTGVAEYLQGKLGVAVKYLPVKSYQDSVTAFTNNQVQMAWFGGLTGGARRRGCGLRRGIQGQAEGGASCD